MAYIATKATYIGEEEVKDENGKPAIDDNGNPVKRITTDVDDVVFEAGEVIVLVEKINDGKHFDLEIEDKGSTYFAPTQIKIGDGMHSFGELNWLQTIDDFKVQSTIDKKIATYKTNVDKIYETFVNSVNAKIGEQNNLINNFVTYQSKEILRDLVQDNYFSISSNGVLSAFSGTEIPTVNNLKSFSIGNYNTFYNKTTEQMGRYCAVFGNNHNMFGFNNYSFGYNNSIDGAYILAHGFQNVINTSKDNKWTVCFGHKNQINNVDNNIVIGMNNIIQHSNTIVIGSNNTTISTDSIILGRFSSAGIGGAVIGIDSNAGIESFAAGRLCNYNKTIKEIGSYSACFGVGCYTKGTYSFACGQLTEALMNNSFACGVYNDGNNKIFSIGNGTEEERSNIFDIDTSGKATFYGDLEIKGQIVDNMQFINKTDFNKLKEQVNNIVITSTGDGNATLEVVSARVGLNNINYSSLSDRLDADFEKCVDKSQLDSAIQEALAIDDLEISGGIINSNRGNSIYDTNGNRKGLLAMGEGNTASGTRSIAMGLNNTASGPCSTATGGNNTSSGDSSVAMGAGNKAIAPFSISMGGNNTSSGQLSIAMGSENKADREYSVAIGRQNTASSNNSVAIGSQNTASGHLSMAIGSSNKAYGTYSIAMGENSITSGLQSVAIGTGLITIGDYQTALGRYNVDETELDMHNLFVLGNGTSTSNRSNAMEVDAAGNLSMNRDVVANAFGDSPISLVELSNRIGLVEEKLAKLVTPGDQNEHNNRLC